MEKKCKVLIVDDHDLFRSGIKMLFEKDERIEIVGEASNGADFLEIMEKIKSDVVLMDVSMPVMNGIETTCQAVGHYPDIKVLVLSMFDNEEYYYKMIQAGAKGFVLKSSGIRELEHAILNIAQGGCFFSEELLRHVIVNLEMSNQEANKADLSGQEIKVLICLAQNQSDDEIAESLTIEPAEIQTIRKNLIQKTGSSNTAALILYAVKNNIVSI